MSTRILERDQRSLRGSQTVWGVSEGFEGSWLVLGVPRGVFGVGLGDAGTEHGVMLQVGQLFEEGVRRAQSSDSSRRAFSVYSSSRAPGRYAPSYTPRSAPSPGSPPYQPGVTPLSPRW